jgi:hypothetical protein
MTRLRATILAAVAIFVVGVCAAHAGQASEALLCERLQLCGDLPEFQRCTAIYERHETLPEQCEWIKCGSCSLSPFAHHDLVPWDPKDCGKYRVEATKLNVKQRDCAAKDAACNTCVEACFKAYPPTMANINTEGHSEAQGRGTAGRSVRLPPLLIFSNSKNWSRCTGHCPCN